MMKRLSLAGIIFLYSVSLSAQQVTDSIRLNQVGFYPLAQKLAVVTGLSEQLSFYVVDTTKHDTIFTGLTDKPIPSKNSSIKGSLINFSKVQRPGVYDIIIPGVGQSYPFEIKQNVLEAPAKAGLKGFYFMRSDMPLLPAYAGQWARPGGHPDTAVLIHPSAASPERPAGTTISTPGGWYDAGDYNKYIVNAGITTGTLLSAYEDFPAYFKTLKTNIPESGDAVPDILNEILYNLRWMFTMQDPNDGGVYNKTTNADFDGMSAMPGATKLPRYVVQKGTAATLDLVAVMAQASRIFKPFNKQLPGLSDSCLQAATKGWDWAKKNPAVEYNQNTMNRMMNKPAINTGGYGDRVFADEWEWASSEMYITTKDEAYYTLIGRSINDKLSLPSWNNVHLLGVYSLLRNAASLPPTHAADIQKLKAGVLSLADSYLEHIMDNAFHTVMGQSPRDFNWGSNSNAANQGILLINAFILSKNTNYIDAAITNADYILGRNATGYSFITGIGSKSPMHPHHRPSVGDGIEAPVPGLMAGGPNPGRQDNCTYAFTEPETAYVDSDCSYASNEIAINWNAPLVYLLNGLEALQYDAGFSKKATK